MLQKVQRFRFSSVLKSKMEEVIAKRQAEFQAFKKEHSNTKIADITIGQVIGGMRGMQGMMYETSKLHPENGIKYRQYDLFQVRELAPKAIEGGQPIIEGVLWLLLTGELPTKQECNDFQKELQKRGSLSREQENLIKQFPKHMHPMTQFSMGVMTCQPDSHFVKAYSSGVHKSKYWVSTLEDALDVCAKVSRIATLVYHNSFKNTANIPNSDPSLDYGANFAQMLGFDNQNFWELMRLYLVIHADHEGGNVSAHTSHLVGSALSDPYLSFAAALNGLSGPLHGLANQECTNFILEFQKIYGTGWTKEDIKDHVANTLKAGKVVPGYGHATLRKTDPRFICELEFAERYIKNDNLVDLVKANYEVIPGELAKTGKISNPWPNVDAGSGALLMHYGLTQQDFYTVLFGVSRAFGVTSAQVWSRALGMPIERPNSYTLDHLKALVNKS